MPTLDNTELSEHEPKLSEEEARGFAALAWTFSKTSHITMDPNLAEAFAERIHERVRKEFWGYAADESLSNEELIHCRYQGIRPAPGYPACPDHTEKKMLFDLLDVKKTTGIQLTENFAMLPAASVSGIYFSHPQAKYFWLGSIQKDQVEDLANRKNMDKSELEKWLSPNLGYDP